MSSGNTETRERILRSTWEALESGGSSGVRMSDIAKKAGISRQAVYLHFPSRAELLVETTRYVDVVYKIQDQLHASRNAATGEERLDAWIEAWGNYIPKIYGVGRALMAMADDQEAQAAWDDRMNAVRSGCVAAVADINRDGRLNPAFGKQIASDLLWTLLSVRCWEQLTKKCGWTQKAYIDHVKQAARAMLVER